MRGFEFALYDIGLATFTTLAPAAAFAYVALALYALVGRLDKAQRSRLESWLILPLAIATVGLIASATHLGDPGNALYVFKATGTSPLSNEVLTAVLFLGTACSYWLACVYLPNMRVLRVVWLLWNIVTALAFIWGTASAYRFSTVITWNTPYALVNLPLTGLAGCAPLAALVLVCAGSSDRVRLVKVLGGISLAAGAAACVSMALQNANLATMANAYGTATELAPHYPLAIALFGLCIASALVLTYVNIHASSTSAALPDAANTASTRRKTLLPLIAAVIIAYGGIFAVRFSFYCFHMTSGLV